MFSVSSSYRTQFDRDVRNPSHVRLNFQLYDPDVEGNYSITGDEAYYSDVVQITDESVADIPYVYATLEKNMFFLDGDVKLMPEIDDSTIYQGYVSNDVSDVSSVFQLPPSLEISFVGYFEFVGLTYAFDNVNGDYPSSLRIKAFEDDTEVFNEIIYPDSWSYSIISAIPLCNRITFEFLTSNLPERRVRLSYLILGINEWLYDADLYMIEYKKIVDPLSAKLPVQDFNFTFFDLSSKYDPDNPSGLYGYLEKGQPVTFDFGYELDDGTIEWVTGGRNYSTGEVKVESQGRIPKVTFNTSSVLGYLTQTYTNGVYCPAGKTLLQLATEVMSFAGLPSHPSGGDMYEFDSSLSSYSTTLPLPVLSIRDCLQLIANAGMCILDVSRQGKITISPINSVANDFTLDLTKSKSIPKVEKYPVLRKVMTSYFIPSIGSSEVLISQDVSVATPTLFLFDYDASYNQSLSVSSGVTIEDTPQYFAKRCEVTLSGTGTITIYGQKLSVSENFVTVNYNVNGEDCPIKNDLIVTLDHATDYAEWVGNIVNLSNVYNVDNRGFPELDPTDVLYLETLYSEKLKVILLENIIKYNGALSGKSKFLIGM